MRTYFDSSALVKLLVEEPGREWTQGCWTDSHVRCTSRLSYVEVRAALASANRAKRISDSELANARDEFENLWERVQVFEPTPTVVREAANHAERHGLRGYDAVHVASALVIHRADPLLMLTWDNDLAQAAFDSGINVIRTADA